MRYDCHITYRAPYVGICECAVSSKTRRLSSLSLSEICTLVSQVISSVNFAFELTGVSGVNTVGECKGKKFKT